MHDILGGRLGPEFDDDWIPMARPMPMDDWIWMTTAAFRRCMIGWMIA